MEREAESSAQILKFCMAQIGFLALLLELLILHTVRSYLANIESNLKIWLAFELFLTFILERSTSPTPIMGGGGCEGSTPVGRKMSASAVFLS